MNRLYVALFILFLPTLGLASEDSMCVLNEGQRLDALRSIAHPVNELLKKQEDSHQFVSSLNPDLLIGLPKSMREGYVMITGENGRRMKHALNHYCIIEYQHCGHKGSSCFVSLINGDAACFEAGVECATEK